MRAEDTLISRWPCTQVSPHSRERIRTQGKALLAHLVFSLCFCLLGSGFRDWVLSAGFTVLGTRFWAQGLGFSVLGTRFWVQGLGSQCWVLGSGFRDWVLSVGSQCWVLGSGFRDWVLSAGY